MMLYPKRGNRILPRIYHPHLTALIICDMWDNHWCAGASARVAEMAPRINALACVMREAGALVIHSPSDTMDFYAGHPARLKLTHTVIPSFQLNSSDRLNKTLPPLGLDSSDEGCDCLIACEPRKAWTCQTPVIEIHDCDIIGDDDRVLSYMKLHSITDVVFAGVHTNMCVIGRPFGLKKLMANGFYPMLVRDLTDTMYNHLMPPYVGHFRGNEIIAEYIEAYIASTITSDNIAGGEPFRFAGNE